MLFPHIFAKEVGDDNNSYELLVVAEARVRDDSEKDARSLA